MSTTIEITSHAIRLVRENRGRIVAIESFPAPEGADPLDALAAAPLPQGLGKVRVVLHHGDMLLRTMMQPPAPADRLDRIVRFELQGLAREESDPVAVSWHAIRAMGGSDLRILALLTKRRLIGQIDTALAKHGAKLGSLIHPAVALFHAWKRQEAAHHGDGVLLDIGGRHVHLVLVHDGELLFLRAQSPGMDELVSQIAELRGIGAAEAAKLVARIGKGAPADLHDAIRRHAQTIAGLVQNNVRFARAQLHVEKFDPTVVWIAGAGGQVHGLSQAVGERLRATVRLLNPFAGTLSAIPAEQLDPMSALPSPWTNALGAMGDDELELDATTEERQRRAMFWKTDGALRLAAAAAVALLAIAVVRQSVAIGSAEGTLTTLRGENNDGLVPKAEEVHAQLTRLADKRTLAESKLRFLDGERRPGRIAVELLAAIAEQQDPAECPVVLTNLQVRRKPGQVEVVVEGFASSAPGRTTADVLRAFESRLVRRYQPIGGLEQLPKAISRDRQEFGYLLTVPDRAPSLVGQERSGDGRQLKVTIATDPGLSPEAVALASAVRLRQSEEEVRISVRPEGGKGPVEFTWSPARGLMRGEARPR